jgi:hypothetical protein
MLQFEEIKQTINVVKEELKKMDTPAGNRDYIALSTYHEAAKVKLSERGKADGGNEQPPQNDESQSVEKETKAAYAAQYLVLMQQELSAVARLKNLFESLQKQFFTTPEGEMRKQIKEYEQSFDYAKIANRRPGGSTNGWHYCLKNGWVIYVIMVVLGVLELPLNYTVFQAFKLSKAQTYLAASLLIVIIPITCHSAGRFLKRWHEGPSAKVWAISLSTLLLLFSFSICLFRYVYFEAKGNMTASGASITLSEAFRRVPTIGAFSNSEFYLTLFFNILLIVVGVILGYVVHDSSQSFESHYKNYHFARLQIQKKLQQLQENSKIQTELSGIESQETEYMYLLTTMTQLYNEMLNKVTVFGETVNHYFIETINLYKEGSQSTRKTPGPAYWLNSPELPVLSDPTIKPLEFKY